MISSKLKFCASRLYQESEDNQHEKKLCKSYISDKQLLSKLHEELITQWKDKPIKMGKRFE